MSKITLTDPANKNNIVGPIIENNTRIEEAIENTLSRDGSSPNEMNANLDMNGFRILNLPEPTLASDLVRLQDLEGVASTYILPQASTTVLGGIKDGAGVTVATDGTLSSDQNFGSRPFYGFFAEVAEITTTSYTLTDADSGKILRFTAATDIAVVLPNSLSKGWVAMISQRGAGKVILNPAGGATLSNSHSFNSTSGQHTALSLMVDSNADGSSAAYVFYGEGSTAVGAYVPVNVTLPSISGNPISSSTLTASVGAWTQSPISYSYQWKRGGSNIAGATNTTYTLQSADVGYAITVTVVAINGIGSSDPATSAATANITMGAPSNTVAPVVAGTAQEALQLSCTTGTWANSPTTYTYQWYADGVAIPGATSSTYTVQSGYVGAIIRCTVTATNATASTSANSNNVGPVLANGVPVNSVLPAITGLAADGFELTSSTGTWSNSPTSYAYQWKADGSNVGTNDDAYTPGTGDIGKVITVTVTATNIIGASAPATSLPTSAVITGTKILDGLSATAEVAISTRKLRSAYTGYALRVRRSSDSAEQDIGFDSNGDLDVAALASFVGSGTADIQKWYDQSGNSYDFTPAFAYAGSYGNRWQIRRTGTNITRNGKVIANGNAAGNNGYSCSTAFTTAGALSICLVGANLGGGGSDDPISIGNNNYYSSPIRWPGNICSWGDVSPTSNVTWDSGGFITSEGWQSFCITGNTGGTFNAYQGNVSKKSSSLSGINVTGTARTIQLGRKEATTSSTIMDFGELIIFKSVISSDDRTDIYDSQKAYWGTP